MQPTVIRLKMAPDVPLLMTPQDAAICDRYHDLGSAELVAVEYNLPAARVLQVLRLAKRRIGHGKRLANRK